MKKVLLFDPLETLPRHDMPPPTTAWEGFEAAVQRMARGENVSGERQEASAEEEIGEEEEEEGKQGEEMEAEQGEDTKTTSSRRYGQQTSCECRREVGEHVWCVASSSKGRRCSVADAECFGLSASYLLVVSLFCSGKKEKAPPLQP